MKNVPYCSSPKDVALLPSVGEGIALLNRSGFKVIIITNQSGLARGYFTEDVLDSIHLKMKMDLAAYGARIDAIYYCPHHTDDGCQCRKPNPGLLQHAIAEWDINPASSYFIGDKYSDAEAASRAGCKSVLLPSDEPETDLFNSINNSGVRVDFFCRSFFAAVNWLLVERARPVRISVVIPTLNEQNTLPHVLPRISQDYEVILVDGHSTDSTVAVARELRPDIKVLYQPGRGKGDAMRYGFQHATGDIIFTMDADGSFNVDEMSSFIMPLLNGYHMVKGSRFLSGGGTDDMTAFRAVGDKIMTNLANVLHHAQYTDLVYGYHAFQRRILGALELESNGFEIDTEMYIKAQRKGFRVAEVPSFENNRLSGNSKLQSFSDGGKIIRTIIKEYLVG